MVQIALKKSIERVPGGMMVVPLLVGALLATFFPGTPKFFGSFTGALFSGALTILAVFYVCMGASIDLKATPYILKKGGTLLGVKVGMAHTRGLDRDLDHARTRLGDRHLIDAERFSEFAHNSGFHGFCHTVIS